MAPVQHGGGENQLTPLLQILHSPSTPVQPWQGTQLGLGWFINGPDADSAGSIWKDGGLDTTTTYIAFLPSADPGQTPSSAGVFVMMNGGEMTYNQKNDGDELSAALANDILRAMQGLLPLEDKSRYARSVFPRPKKKRPDTA